MTRFINPEVIVPIVLIAAAVVLGLHLSLGWYTIALVFIVLGCYTPAVPAR